MGNFLLHQAVWRVFSDSIDLEIEAYVVKRLYKRNLSTMPKWARAVWATHIMLGWKFVHPKIAHFLYWATIAHAANQYTHDWEYQPNGRFIYDAANQLNLTRLFLGKLFGKRKQYKPREVSGEVNYPFPHLRTDRFDARTAERVPSADSYRAYQDPPPMQPETEEICGCETTSTLKRLAKQLGVSQSGRKSEIAGRVARAQNLAQFLSNDPPAYAEKRPDLQGRVVASEVQARSPKKFIKTSHQRMPAGGNHYGQVSSQFGRNRPPSLGIAMSESRNSNPDITKFSDQVLVKL
jgi:hypothetical protein